MATIHDFGFYTINPDYLEYLNSVDSEVYYSPSYRNSTKPFIGIIVLITVSYTHLTLPTTERV